MPVLQKVYLLDSIITFPGKPYKKTNGAAEIIMQELYSRNLFRTAVFMPSGLNKTTVLL
jgi:hypothetical protein